MVTKVFFLVFIFVAFGIIYRFRGLHLFLHVFECVVTDHERNVKTEDLTAFVQEGYAETLQPYHGWMTQKIFHVRILCKKYFDIKYFQFNDVQKKMYFGFVKTGNSRLIFFIWRLVESKYIFVSNLFSTAGHFVNKKNVCGSHGIYLYFEEIFSNIDKSF